MCIALEQKQTKSNPKNLMLTFHNHENKHGMTKVSHEIGVELSF